MATTVSDMIKIMKAYRKGAKIEVGQAGSWVWVEHPTWDWAHFDYRVAASVPQKVTTAQISEWAEQSGMGQYVAPTNKCLEQFAVMAFREGAQNKGAAGRVGEGTPAKEDNAVPAANFYSSDSSTPSQVIW